VHRKLSRATKSLSQNTYHLLDKSCSNVGSDLDVQDDTDLLQANPDGKHTLNGELDNDVDRATGEAARGETTNDDAHQDPEDHDQDVEGEFGVEAIRGHRFVRGKVYYETKWRGYPDKENTEETESSLLL
jgi:hypothetical protein